MRRCSANHGASCPQQQRRRFPQETNGCPQRKQSPCHSRGFRYLRRSPSILMRRRNTLRRESEYGRQRPARRSCFHRPRQWQRPSPRWNGPGRQPTRPRRRMPTILRDAWLLYLCDCGSNERLVRSTMRTPHFHKLIQSDAIACNDIRRSIEDRLRPQSNRRYIRKTTEINHRRGTDRLTQNKMDGLPLVFMKWIDDGWAALLLSVLLVFIDRFC